MAGKKLTPDPKKKYLNQFSRSPDKPIRNQTARIIFLKLDLFYVNLRKKPLMIITFLLNIVVAILVSVDMRKRKRCVGN